MHAFPTRLVPLEAYRGIAALIVLVHHFFLAFSPMTTGALPELRNDKSLIGDAWFFIVSGEAAVAFFFVLSGFVLCWSYFHDENPEKLRKAFLKRLPRLAGLVVVTTLTSYLLFRSGAYYFHPAAQLSKSPWLASFAYAGWTEQFEPSFWAALVQGVSTFFTGSRFYNTSLWTMQVEFFGSLMVYMLAAFIVVVLKHRNMLIALVLLSLSSIYFTKYMFAFVAGVFLCAYVVKQRPKLSLPGSIGLIAVALYALGYAIPAKSYAWVSLMPYSVKYLFEHAVLVLGAASIIFATMANSRLFTVLNGSVCSFLGKISFPLYLVHVLVICSFSSYGYLWLAALQHVDAAGLLSLFLATVTLSVVISVVLSILDDWWVSLVNQIVGASLQRTTTSSNAA